MSLKDEIYEEVKRLTDCTTNDTPAKTAVYMATLDMADFVKDLLLKQVEDYLREHIYKVCNEEGEFRQRFITNFISAIEES